MVRLKALVVVGDGLEDYGDLLAVGRAEAKRMLRTHENVNVKDILYSATCAVHLTFHFSAALPPVGSQSLSRTIKYK